MTYVEVKEIVESIGYPYTYYEFKDGPVEMPFVVYHYPQRMDLYADGQNFAKIEQLIIELYTSEKDFEAEAHVESVLTTAGFSFDKAERRWESEHSYEVIYSMEVLINE